MKFPRRYKPFLGSWDAAPFAGVFFLLVLMLWLQSAIAPAPGVRVQLPESGAADVVGTLGPTLVVTLDQNQVLYFEHQVTTEADLGERLALKAKAAAGKAPLTLLVRADASVPQGAVVRLASVARRAGIPEIRLETRPPLFRAPAATAARP